MPAARFVFLDWVGEVVAAAQSEDFVSSISSPLRRRVLWRRREIKEVYLQESGLCCLLPVQAAARALPGQCLFQCRVEV
jgi:hypothetical protein